VASDASRASSSEPGAVCDLTDAVRTGLAQPGAYAHRPRTVEVRETHISWVFLAGERAFKLKKPVVLEFVDYGSAARRHELCREEVRLNRRLAPDIYLGVRGVARTDSGVELTSEDDPRAIEFVVEMRRYDERRTLAALLERGELDGGQVRAVGGVLARFHERARRVQSGSARVLALERRFERNVHELVGRIEAPGELDRVQALTRFAHAFIARHGAVLEHRARQGRVREGHGDLRAEHVMVNGDVRVVDCVEFDRSLRELDVGDDLSFLVQDLVARGAGPLAELLVAAYRDAGGDPGEDSLIAFFATYRALVRAKVALVRAGQLPPAGGAVRRELERAGDLMALAERFAWRARLPLVIVVCGLPASGKSHLAQALSALCGLPHVSSDVTRKQLRGLQPTERAPGDTYSLEWNIRTYTELARQAADEVERGGGAIVDATFRHVADRVAFTSALGGAAPLLFIECQAPRSVRLERAARRQQLPERVSDADVAVVSREQRSWEPLDEVSPNAHVVLRTDRPGNEIVADALALLDRRLPALH
jgi:aminoglycoside phosphotransferase family enzyme/predicted kinase